MLRPSAGFAQFTTPLLDSGYNDKRDVCEIYYHQILLFSVRHNSFAEVCAHFLAPSRVYHKGELRRMARPATQTLL